MRRSRGFMGGGPYREGVREKVLTFRTLNIQFILENESPFPKKSKKKLKAKLLSFLTDLKNSRNFACNNWIFRTLQKHVKNRTDCFPQFNKIIPIQDCPTPVVGSQCEPSEIRRFCPLATVFRPFRLHKRSNHGILYTQYFCGNDRAFRIQSCRSFSI